MSSHEGYKCGEFCLFIIKHSFNICMSVPLSFTFIILNVQIISSMGEWIWKTEEF